MTNIIIQGICGRMGRALQEKIAARTDCRVVAGVDQTAGAAGAADPPGAAARPSAPCWRGWACGSCGGTTAIDG